jgi:hypothetical protein
MNKKIKEKKTRKKNIDMSLFRLWHGWILKKIWKTQKFSWPKKNGLYPSFEGD